MKTVTIAATADGISACAHAATFQIVNATPAEAVTLAADLDNGNDTAADSVSTNFGFWDVGVTDGDTSAADFATPTTLLNAIDAPTAHTSVTSVFAVFFTIDHDVNLIANWDFSVAVPRTLVLIDIFGTPLLEADGDSSDINFDPMGTASIWLTAGTTYGVLTNFTETAGPTPASGFASLVIPAPGASAVIGKTGLVAARRRRG